jgi:cytoskeletal protein RodZ
MSDEELAVADPAEHNDAAQLLSSARKAKGMSLDQVSATTRITTRHLGLIEEGKFAALPGRTYAIGFAKNFARVVGVDEEHVANLVREEFGESAPAYNYADQTENFEPGDPGKVPSNGLAIVAGIAALLLIGGIFAFYNTYFGSGNGPGSLLASSDAEQGETGPSIGDGESEESAAAVSAEGPVVFTATDEAWVRIYDGTQSTVLFESLMKKGDSWTLPDTAVDPQINTGRPDALNITIGGTAVPVLDPEPVAIVNVQVSAKALLARGQEPAEDASAEETAPAQ